MLMRVETQVAYILHKRPYRDTSQILDVFTRDYGRVSLMSRGSRNPRAKVAGLLQIVRPLLVSWGGRGDLCFLNRVELAELRPPKLMGNSLKSAMYINELLIYMLHKNDVHADVFDLYHECLYALSEISNIERVLRLFEKQLLQQLGFGLNLVTDADTGKPVEKHYHYVYHFEHGPVLCQENRSSMRNPVLSGDSLIAYENNQLESERHFSEIKSLMRYVLNGHLGQKKLRSRELFRKSMRGAAPASA
jgi:DNA repair protein RecO (recombination protein O)